VYLFITLPLYNSYKLRSWTDAWILWFQSVWMLGTWEIQKWQLRNNNVEVNLVNRDHINCHTAIYSCRTMLIFFMYEVSFSCGFIGNDIKRSQHVTKCNVLCMFVCVCVCVCTRTRTHAWMHVTKSTTGKTSYWESFMFQWMGPDF